MAATGLATGRAHGAPFNRAVTGRNKRSPVGVTSCRVQLSPACARSGRKDAQQFVGSNPTAGSLPDYELFCRGRRECPDFWSERIDETQPLCDGVIRQVFEKLSIPFVRDRAGRVGANGER